MVFIVCLYFDFLNKMSSKLLSKYFEISKNVVILRSQKTQNLGHWTAAQVVYLKQISGPYRLHRSILSSQTVYTPVQIKNKNTLIDSSTIVVIPKKNRRIQTSKEWKYYHTYTVTLSYYVSIKNAYITIYILIITL